MVKCKICNKEILPSEKPYILKGYSFHEKCFSEVSDTYKSSKTVQKLVNFAFKRLSGKGFGI